MEILHFEDLGIQMSFGCKTVVLAPGEYQVSIAKYLGGGGGGIYPHKKR